jgi:hypothetical protein
MFKFLRLLGRWVVGRLFLGLSLLLSLSSDNPDDFSEMG